MDPHSCSLLLSKCCSPLSTKASTESGNLQHSVSRSLRFQSHAHPCRRKSSHLHVYEAQIMNACECACRRWHGWSCSSSSWWCPTRVSGAISVAFLLVHILLVLGLVSSVVLWCGLLMGNLVDFLYVLPTNLNGSIEQQRHAHRWCGVTALCIEIDCSGL